MALFSFKLLGIPNETSEREIEIPVDTRVEDAEEIVRKSYRMLPSFQVQFMLRGVVLPRGKKLAQLNIDPVRDQILVIGTRD